MQNNTNSQLPITNQQPLITNHQSLITLNNNYSTTRLCCKLLDDKELNENGQVKEELKFNINKPEFGIVDSKIPAKESEKFDTLLFLTEGEGRKGEGGLRTKGYFKFSYKNLMMNNEWLILNDMYGNRFKLDKNSLNNSKFKIQNLILDQLPLITIITVVYNGEKYLEETIKSVISQTYPNVEYIIIDGGSTDGTLDIIKKYEDYIDYWVSEEDKGIYDAMNKGVQLSFGKWLSFLGTGDIMREYALSEYSKRMKSDKYYDLISSKIGLYKTKGKIIRVIGKRWRWKEFKKRMTVVHVGCLQNNALFKTYGLFNIDFKIAGDYEFLLRPKDKLMAYFVDRVLVEMELSGISSTDINTFYESYKAQVMHKTEKINLISKCYMYWFIFKWKIRRLIWY